MPVQKEPSQKARGTSLAHRFLCLGGDIPRDQAHLVWCEQPALKEGPVLISSAQPLGMETATKQCFSTKFVGLGLKQLVTLSTERLCRCGVRVNEKGVP